jgi:hypothetical protein
LLFCCAISTSQQNFFPFSKQLVTADISMQGRITGFHHA